MIRSLCISLITLILFAPTIRAADTFEATACRSGTMTMVQGSKELMILGFEFRGTDEQYALEIRRGVAQFHENLPAGNYTLLEIDKGYLSKNPLNFVNLKRGKEEGKVVVKGNWDEVETFFGFFDFEPHPLWLTVR